MVLIGVTCISYHFRWSCHQQHTTDPTDPLPVPNETKSNAACPEVRRAKEPDPSVQAANPAKARPVGTGLNLEDFEIFWYVFARQNFINIINMVWQVSQIILDEVATQPSWISSDGWHSRCAQTIFGSNRVGPTVTAHERAGHCFALGIFASGSPLFVFYCLFCMFLLWFKDLT